MSDENIKGFYEKYDEHGRMARNPLEYIRCKEIISRYLPEPPARVLDIGGASGAFSFWMAGLGHSVDLVDFTPKHIDLARRIDSSSGSKLRSASVGDARSLAFADAGFDLVLMMGPLYHLVERSDRIKALGEARRVLRQGGVLVYEAISRYASALDGFIQGFADDPEFFEILTRDLETGYHKDTSKAKSYFTDSYFHSPHDFVEEMREAGFRHAELVAVEGFGHLVPDLDEKLRDPAFREKLEATLRLIEKNGDIMGVSNHFMGIGSKP